MSRLTRSLPRVAAPCTCPDCQRLDLQFPGEGRQLALCVAPSPQQRGG